MIAASVLPVLAAVCVRRLFHSSLLRASVISAIQLNLQTARRGEATIVRAVVICLSFHLFRLVIFAHKTIARTKVDGCCRRDGGGDGRSDAASSIHTKIWRSFSVMVFGRSLVADNSGLINKCALECKRVADILDNIESESTRIPP